MNASRRDVPSRITCLSIVSLIVAACGAATPASPTPAPATPLPSASAPSAPAPSSTGSLAPTTSPSAAIAGHVERAASMVMARTGFYSELLGDGTILAVGDDFACYPGPATKGSETAERYDPANDTWSKAESLNKPRKTFAMVALRDGTAMVIGGVNPTEDAFSSTKVFHPGSGTWSDGPLLRRAVGQPLAATLTDGRVMTFSPGTVGETGYRTAVEIYDPGSPGWVSAAEVGIYVDQVLALTGGGLLVEGAAFESPPLLYRYDPKADRWTNIAAPIDVANSFDYGRFGPLVPLDDGSVLALSVARSSSDPYPSSRVERLDPATGRWSEAASMSTPRQAAMIVRLADGRVLVAGGATSDENEPDGRAFATTEVYDPGADGWSPGPNLLEPRKDGHATQLADGSVLIYGGDADFNVEGDVPWCPSPMNSAERVYLGS